MSLLTQLAMAKSQLARGEPSSRVIGRLTFGSEQLETIQGFARQIGFPVFDYLTALETHHRFELQVAAKVSQTVKPIRMSATLMFLLPVITILMAQSLGLNPLRILLLTPIGWLLSLVAGTLIGLAWQRFQRLIQVASQSRPDVGLWAQVLVLAMQAGMSAQAARKLFASKVPNLPAAHSIIELEAESSQLRQRLIDESELMLAALPIKLLVPLGLYLLPSSLLLTLVPIAIGAMGQQMLF